MRPHINDGDKIIVIKLGSIGDVVHTLPALVALRMQFRHSYIGWFIEQKSLNLIKGHPLLDKVFIFQHTIIFGQPYDRYAKSNFNGLLIFKEPIRVSSFLY